MFRRPVNFVLLGNAYGGQLVLTYILLYDCLPLCELAPRHSSPSLSLSMQSALLQPAAAHAVTGIHDALRLQL